MINKQKATVTISLAEYEALVSEGGAKELAEVKEINKGLVAECARLEALVNNLRIMGWR